MEPLCDTDPLGDSERSTGLSKGTFLGRSVAGGLQSPRARRDMRTCWAFQTHFCPSPNRCDSKTILLVERLAWREGTNSLDDYPRKRIECIFEDYHGHLQRKPEIPFLCGLQILPADPTRFSLLTLCWTNKVWRHALCSVPLALP